VEVESAEVAM
jgi:hypothetical protein